MRCCERIEKLSNNNNVRTDIFKRDWNYKIRRRLPLIDVGSIY